MKTKPDSMKFSYVVLLDEFFAKLLKGHFVIGSAANICDVSIRQLSYWTDKGQIKAEGDNNRAYDFYEMYKTWLVKVGLDNGLSLDESLKTTHNFFATLVAPSLEGYDTSVTPPIIDDNNYLAQIGHETLMVNYRDQWQKKLNLSIGYFESLEIISRRQASYWTDKAILESLSKNSEVDDDKEDAAKCRCYDFANMFKAFVISKFLDSGYGLNGAVKQTELLIKNYISSPSLPVSTNIVRQNTFEAAQRAVVINDVIANQNTSLNKAILGYLVSLFVMAKDPLGKVYNRAQLQEVMDKGLKTLLRYGILEETMPDVFRLSPAYRQKLFGLLNLSK